VCSVAWDVALLLLYLQFVVLYRLAVAQNCTTCLITFTTTLYHFVAVPRLPLIPNPRVTVLMTDRSMREFVSRQS